MSCTQSAQRSFIDVQPSRRTLAGNGLRPVRVLFVFTLVLSFARPTIAQELAELSADELRDRIYGGWVGMLIGGIEGLPHEFKYRENPREELPEFTFLAGGARSDDDNDIEWTHLYFMYKEGMLFLPYPRLAEIWKANMNQGVWRANKAARELMEQGTLPPETGDFGRNPHAWYNLSGQFAVESYGLIAPGMPQKASQLALHYARIAVSGEPLQAAQFWASMVSLAFFHRGSVDELIDKALGATDPACALREAVADAREALGTWRDDWKAARQQVHRQCVVERGWNDNSTPTNGALVCLALLYGKGDFYRTLQYAMALGHDADCNAATAGAVVGTLLGWKRIRQLPQCQVVDRYVNRTRPQLPAEIAISEQVDILCQLAERCIEASGGKVVRADGKVAKLLVPLQAPRPLELLPPGAPRPRPGK
ncbi:MAG: ADP-ribosylglycohydrolase family protein [Thermoguttaceae bacterium]|nr:ADP-ribosylglycohydrolase family protein [Thermoguttaceae bacterium]MDW8078283.1 ADP-ribosylglycohydrolase family protein [Thermoguttaceae bacterium]